MYLFFGIIFCGIFCSSVFAEPVQGDIEPVQDHVRIVYTGNRQGIGKQAMFFSSTVDWKESWNVDAYEMFVHHGMLVRDQWIVFGDNGELEGLDDFFRVAKEDASKVRCQKQRMVAGWQTKYEQLFVLGDAPTDMPLRERPVEYYHWICSAESHAIQVINKSEETLPSWDLEQFEFRPTLQLRDADSNVYVVMKMIQESSRVVQNILDKQAEHSVDMYVDAGNFVDGVTSAKSVGLSLHRPYAYQWLSEMHPVALGIGKNELIAGGYNFLEETHDLALPYIATNLRIVPPQDAPQNIQAMVDTQTRFPRYRVVSVANVQGKKEDIVFLSIIDPALLEEIPQLSKEGFVITDPLVAIREVIYELSRTSIQPSAVILLTTASSDVLQSIRYSSQGVDIMIGDPSLATLRVEQRVIDLKQLERKAKGAPITLPTDSIQVLDLHMEAGTLQQIVNHTIEITESHPKNPVLSAQITNNRMPYYKTQNKVVLQSSRKGWNQYLSQEEWEALICSLVLEKTKADTVILHDLPRFSSLPGSITAKRVADSLAINDVVEVHEIPGGNFQRFLDQSTHLASTTCGVLPGTKGPKPRGIPIEPNQMYQVATTDATRQKTPLQLILQGNQSRKVLDKANMETIFLDATTPYSLRQMVLDMLLASPTPIDPIAYVQNQGKAQHTQILLRLQDVSMSLDDFHGANQDKLEAVPETMLNNPSASSRTLRGDMSLEVYGSKNKGNIRYQSNYSAFSLANDMENLGKQEVNDDWKLSASISNLQTSMNIGKTGILPYTELLFDSEFTPLQNSDGTLASKQSDLSVTMGLSSKPWGMVKTIKLGAMANRDMAQLAEKPTEYGGNLQWATSKNISSYALWTSEGGLLVYANTPDDDESDLRWRLSAKTKLTLPVSRYFGVSLYATGLGAQGRTPTNNVVGFGWNMGASLDVLGVFSLMNSVQ